MESSASESAARSKVRQFWPHVVAGIALLSLLVVTTLLWLEIKRRFPVLEPGGYYGSITGIFHESEEAIPFYVERTPDSEDLFFCVLRSGWKPQMVSAVIRSGKADSGWLLPITVSGEQYRLKFIGARTGPGEYRGTVTNADSPNEGQWRLAAVKAAVAAPTGDEDLKLWLRQRSELQDLDNQIKEAEERVPKQKADIERLSGFISERGQVQANTEVKLASAQDILSTTKRDLVERRDKLEKLREHVEIAQRASPAGKLVLLARESLDRDARWAESLLRTSGAETVAGLDVAVEKGKQIQELKRQIELERNWIFVLKNPAADRLEGIRP